jgi:alkanesulfonate monooxygenase SsuD/methylene tetrahydromethanopterin reductase-like flavin-dependent oxidoreductase (luciferase family)
VKQFKPKNMRRADFEKFSLVGSPDECAAKLSPYLDLGVTYFMLFFADLPETNSLRLFAETVLKQMG